LEIEVWDATWVTFGNANAAQEAVKRWNGARSRVRDRKLRVQLDSQHVAHPKAWLLTDWQRQKKARAGILTKTVRITGLPEGHTMTSLNLLLEQFYRYENNFEEGHSTIPESEFHEARGVALVQWHTEDPASHFVSLYDAEYWKNDVLGVEHIPDKEMMVLENEPTKKNVGFWVGGLRTGSTSADIQDMFAPFKLEDVNFPGAKAGSRPPTFAFVFMTQDNAAQFQAHHPHGFKFQRRWVKVRPIDNKKSKGKRRG